MGHKIGDAVRLRDRSDLRGLLDFWVDQAGRVRVVYDRFADGEGRQVAVAFFEPSEAYACPLAAAHFEPVPELVVM